MARQYVSALVALTLLASFTQAEELDSAGRKTSPLRDSNAVLALEKVFNTSGIDNVIEELDVRARTYRAQEHALIQCLKTEAKTDEGRLLRARAARLLGEMRSLEAVPALVENISMRSGPQLVSSEFALGQVRLNYPCVRALVEIGRPAEASIINTIANGVGIGKLEIELAAYCLLKNRSDKSQFITLIDIDTRTILRADVERAIQTDKNNIKALTLLREWIERLEPRLYDAHRRLTEDLTPPEESEHFRQIDTVHTHKPTPDGP